MLLLGEANLVRKRGREVPAMLWVSRNPRYVSFFSLKKIERKKQENFDKFEAEWTENLLLFTGGDEISKLRNIEGKKKNTNYKLWRP